jgi:dienelactone hydrolase
MNSIVASDIYGITPELRALARSLGEGAILLSPWAGDGCPYASEAQAHAAFVAADGLAAYADKLSAAAGSSPVFLVGFSVGATAAWLYAAQQCTHAQSRALLYYGSRIRFYTALKPSFPVRAFFAEHEAAFAPADIVPLIASNTVAVQIVPGSSHGFMNPRSPGFSDILYKEHTTILRHAVQDFLSQ